MAVRDDGLCIRAALAGERGTVVALWRACGLTTSYNDPVADFDLAHDKPSSTVLVGLVSDDIVASAMVGSDGHRGWLYYVSVDPARRKAGYGRAIVSAAETWLVARGIAKVMLMVRDSNAPVSGFYSSIGYADEPRIVMAKWLEHAPHSPLSPQRAPR